MNTISYEDIISKLEHAQEFERYTSALCVFHTDSSPSLLVFKDGWFRCLGCGRHGTWKTLWNKLKGQPIMIMKEERTAFGAPPIRDMGNLEELCYQAHADLIQFPSLGWYLEMRGLQERIETNEIGYVKGWYTFPVRDRNDIFQTAVLRAAPHVQEASGHRYWCRSAPMPYVPDWFLVNNKPVLFVVYGIMDALTLAQLRFPVITSTAGNNTFRAEWLDEFRHTIYIIPDKGEERQATDLADQLGWRGRMLKLEYPQGIKDANGFLEYGKQDELSNQLRSVSK